MVVNHHFEGYENFHKFMENLVADGPIVVLFSGSKDPNTGNSWCSDCVEADPFIQKGMQSAPDTTQFVHVEVGDRPFWKDLNCPFRKDPKLNLKVLPTLMLWGTQQKLEGEQCNDVDLIQLLFTDD